MGGLLALLGLVKPDVILVSLALLARMAEECASADAALCASAALERRQAAEYAAEADRTEASLTRLGLASQQV